MRLGMTVSRSVSSIAGPKLGFLESKVLSVRWQNDWIFSVLHLIVLSIRRWVCVDFVCIFSNLCNMWYFEFQWRTAVTKMANVIRSCSSIRATSTRDARPTTRRRNPFASARSIMSERWRAASASGDRQRCHRDRKVPPKSWTRQPVLRVTKKVHSPYLILNATMPEKRSWMHVTLPLC